MVKNNMTLGEKLADTVANVLGSWTFIGIQLSLIVFWIILNSTSKTKLDEYPYSFLNLILGIQSAMACPILLISGNRQEKLDRKRAIENLEIDKISLEDLRKISKKIEEQFKHLDHDLEVVLDEIEKDK